MMLDVVDKILSRLGIYDIIGVWFSGAIIAYMTKFMLQACWRDISISILEKPFSAILICYAIGLVFQELTSFIHKTCICKNKNRYLRNAITPKSQYYLFMEEKEIDTVNQYVAKKLNLEDSVRKDNIIYYYCKNYYYRNANTIGSERDQVIAAMARSLSFYCFVAIIIPFMKWSDLLQSSTANCCNILLVIGLAVLLIGLGCLFYERFKRFTYRRFITIYRYYLYNEIW